MATSRYNNNTNFLIPLLQRYYIEWTNNTSNKINIFISPKLFQIYHLLWSEQDQPAFIAFPTHFTTDECLPFVINRQHEHHSFFPSRKIEKENLDLISFELPLITENNLLGDNRPFCYEQNIQEQQSIYINNNCYNENDNNEEYTTENQNKNCNEDIVHDINYHNASEYTTPDSLSSAQNTSQIETSNTQFVRVSTRSVNPRQNTQGPQLYETIQNETQNVTFMRDTSVNVSSPTRTIPSNTPNTTRLRYDHPSIPSAFQQSNITSQPEKNNNKNQQTSIHHYDPFNYSFFPQTNTNIQMNNNPNVSQLNNNNSTTHHPYAHLIQTNSSQNDFPPQNQRRYSNVVQNSRRRFQNLPLSQIFTDPLCQMNQNTTHNPTTNLTPVNLVQPELLHSNICQYNKIHS